MLCIKRESWANHKPTCSDTLHFYVISSNFEFQEKSKGNSGRGTQRELISFLQLSSKPTSSQPCYLTKNTKANLIIFLSSTQLDLHVKPLIYHHKYVNLSSHFHHTYTISSSNQNNLITLSLHHILHTTIISHKSKICHHVNS